MDRKSIDDDEQEPRDTQGQIRTHRLPSRKERNWHKKDKGVSRPGWAEDVFYIMTVAANWYGEDWCVDGTEGARRFAFLLEAIRQHFYNEKSSESLLPKDDPRRKKWESRRAKCRVEWQRLHKWNQAFTARIAKLEHDTGTRYECMTAEDRRDLFLDVMEAHNKPGRIPIVIVVDPQDRPVIQARFDAMMSGKKPLDAMALLSWPPQESEIQLLGERLHKSQELGESFTFTATVTRNGR